MRPENQAGEEHGGAQRTVLAEPKMRAELRRGDFSRWRCPGGYVLHEDLVAGEPARIFTFEIDQCWYVGYKTLSDYFVYQDVSGILCSRIYWHNVVGRLDGFRTSDSDVRVSFRPLGIEERRATFAAISPTTEITHPFVNHSERGQEEMSEPDGWPVTEEKARSLDAAEEHLRRYTHGLFSTAFAELGQPIRAYDPACSTGRFLSDFAGINAKKIRTIGQDLSGGMVHFASASLDEVHHGDAMEPAPAAGTVDILFCRFLNSEVVSTSRARELLPQLVATLRPGATMVLMGHTPVLLDILDLEKTGLRVMRTTGRQDDYVFQYFVCEKTE